MERNLSPDLIGLGILSSNNLTILPGFNNGGKGTNAPLNTLQLQCQGCGGVCVLTVHFVFDIFLLMVMSILTQHSN